MEPADSESLDQRIYGLGAWLPPLPEPMPTLDEQPKMADAPPEGALQVSFETGTGCSFGVAFIWRGDLRKLSWDCGEPVLSEPTGPCSCHYFENVASLIVNLSLPHCALP